MRRSILAALVAALLIGGAVRAASATIDIQNTSPFHYGDVLSVVIHGDVPGHPGEPKPKAHLRLDCDYGGTDDYTEFSYSPPSETSIVMHLGLAPSGAGLSDWDLAGGGPADCVMKLYSVNYPPPYHDYAIKVLFDTVSFHVEG